MNNLYNTFLKSGFLYVCLILIAPVISLSYSDKSNQQGTELKKEHAKQFFRNVYAGDSSVLEELIDDNFVSTYPAYKELFNKPGFKGKKEFIDFSNGFKQRWKEGEIVFHEIIAEDNRVVLLWSFSAKRTSSTNPMDVNAAQKFTWGGITMIYFNQSGKIIAEVGLENDPGPYELLRQTQNSN